MLLKRDLFYIKKNHVMSFSFFPHCKIKKNDKAYESVYNSMFYYNNKRYNTNINLTKREKNVFEEELTKVFKEYPILKRNNISEYEEILIKEDDKNKKYKIGDIISLDDHSFGVVLQINQNNTIIGKIYEKNIKNKHINNNIVDININEKKNVYSPYEYLKYLFSKHNKLNIFHHDNKEIYHKRSIKKQLHSNIFLIDIFNKIKYGQKICVIGEKDTPKNVMLLSLIYENLLINTICKNENLFIICSNMHKSELKFFFQKLHELFRQMLNKSGKKKNNNNNNKEIDNINKVNMKIDNMNENKDLYEMNIVEKLYSQNNIYEEDDIKIPNDILWINSTTHYDTQFACYLAPILTTYNLNEYKKKYKNIIMVFYNVTTYNEIVTDLQNYMNIYMKNYYNNKKKEEKESKIKNIWKEDFFITSLPLSAHSIISKYLSYTMYPHYIEKEEEIEATTKKNKCIYDSTSFQNSTIDAHEKNDMSYTLDSYKYYDYINLNGNINIDNLPKNNISNSVTSFCFIDKVQHELNRINDYALSLCDNYILLIGNKYDINPEMDINSFLNIEIMENNQIWYIIKKDIQHIFNKRDEYIKLIESKRKMNIYIDHWEEENFVHYNNIYYIIVYKNFKIFNLNSFQLLVLLRSLIYSNFTNPHISKDHIHIFYQQFFDYYYQNFKYFSILHDEYYKNLKNFKQKQGAQEFINKVDTVIKYIKPNFKNEKNFI
ncbi:conserved Plasmodium protein, unknown function [Plasmodium reichenowi]|uniref:Uncharacterized protein n=1 Tax=Plasmodium reichenowi TaxID=5854 RepID=A0A060RY53_PLARE|nr:conserved Plasmodium protein, unknown function [Plasmodium reichenowi]